MRTKLVAVILSFSLACMGFVTASQAAVVSTQDAVAMQGHASRLADVQATLARSEVRAAMIELGVDPAQAQMRVAALSEQELIELQDRLETAPAGGLLGLIGAVFVVLLILELTGVIDIFKKV